MFSFFAPPRLDVGKGQTATLEGNGPPVVFSPGLFGTMPTFLYRSLFAKMKKNVTLVTLDGLTVVTAESVNRVASALGVEQVGFMSHSSFDVGLLASPRIRSAVLCDPVVLPSLFPTFTPPNIDTTFPVLALRAERSYEVDTPIPNFFEPTPTSASADLWKTECMAGVGHACLLDDTWANMGVQVVPWIQGPVPDSKNFSTWSLHTSRAADVKRIRADYRAKTARLALEHLLH